MTISHVGHEGWPFYYTEIFGTGLQPSDIWRRRRPVWFRNAIPVTEPPWREPGTVDVLVTNPYGWSVTLAAGFTYKAATLEFRKADIGGR